MKLLRILPLFLAWIPAFAQTEPAKPAAKPEIPGVDQKSLLPNQQAFLNLPEERRKEFYNLVKEAERLFQQKRVFETFDALDKADAIFPESPESLNYRGSCYVEIRNFDKAMVAFNKAVKLSPDNPTITFNIAEVFFVTKKWQECHDMFTKVLTKMTTKNLSLRRLVEFKILLCKKKLGMKAEAIALANKYDIDDDSPYYCYAQAAIAYDDKNLTKAEEWLAVAGRIFPNAEVLAPWKDTIIEFGYIKSFYGGDLNDE
jgi:tetratricopeptide (TPR) repeat protein